MTADGTAADDLVADPPRAPGRPAAAPDRQAEALLHALPDPVVLIDRAGTIVAANGAFCRSLGIPAPRLSGTSLFDLVESPPEHARTYVRRCAGSGQRLPGTLTFRTTNAERAEYRCDGAALAACGAGAPLLVMIHCRPKQLTLSQFRLLNEQIVALQREVVARRNAEAAAREWSRMLQARVAEEVSRREQALARLSQAQRLEALGQLAGGIAHDFNNVLQAVDGALGLIQKRSENPQSVRSLARMAGEAARRGAAVTSRLLAFARRSELRARPIRPQAVLEGLKEMLVATLPATIVVQTAADADLPAVSADQAQLETVLVNLAVNARDAMPAGGVLTLAAQTEAITGDVGHQAGLAGGTYVRLDVADTGIGMNAATLARASEPFFTTKPAGQGTGLGLAMARGFAQQSGGGFALRSAPGAGTTVSLWLPRAGTAAADEQTAEGDAEPPEQGASVLVVDDNPTVCATLAAQLEAQGYRVTEASGGFAALARLDAGERPDLLLTDFSMPGMNGLMLIDEARLRLPDLPAMLLTGFADAPLDEAELARDSRTALLRKPVGAKMLAERAAALLRKLPAAEAEWQPAAPG